MNSFLTFFQANLGGFITGGVVAVLQLVVVYLWIDRRVERIQLKSEARKWKEARLELDATLLALAHTLVRPLAYYTRCDQRGVYLRRNYSSCLTHVVDKNATLDAILAIYSIGLEPHSFTRITQLADRLRSAAGNAKAALVHLGRIEGDLPDIDMFEPTRVTGIRRATTSVEFEIPKDRTERAQKLFVYYLLQVLHEVSQIAGLMTREAIRTHDAETLNQSIRYARLRDISNDEQTAARDQARIAESISAIATLVEVIETKGVCLACGPEVD